MSTRREFIQASMLAGAAVLAPRSSQAADSRVEILVNEPIGTISPDIYGHFVEHLGGVVYDGVWVGEDSRVPHYNGVRKALVDEMRKIKPSVMRWPGGCFADSYDWRDGTGPRARRPRKTNFWADAMRQAPNGPQKQDPNWFGTAEFMRFCKLVNAEPYLAANLRSLPAAQFYEWVEYCNSPAGTTTMAELRASDGSREPYNVRYWGVGNESWGCGGDFTPEEYATEFRRFTSWVPRYGVRLAFIPAGPDGSSAGGSIDWTRRFLTHLTAKSRGMLNRVYGWALHYYVGVSDQRDAVNFTTPEWYEWLRRADRMESLINQHWAVMGEVDTERRIKLIVDEWGAWHRKSADLPAAWLFGYPPTLRDALISGLTLDTFHRHADKVVMANVAQLVNTIHSLFLAHEDKFCVTPNFHVFEMYAAHQGATAVRTAFSAPRAAFKWDDKDASLWGLAGSASLRDRQLVLTVVNPHATEAREAEVVLRGASAASGRVKTLTSTDIHAHNTFANPRGVEPTEGGLTARGATFVHRFPAASVTRLTLTLA
jgi:alpha-L-arabinofuranosidase